MCSDDEACDCAIVAIAMLIYLGSVVQRPISANPGKVYPVFFFCGLTYFVGQLSRIVCRAFNEQFVH